MQTLIVFVLVSVATVYVGFYLYRKITRKEDCCTDLDKGDCDLCQNDSSCKIKELKKQVRERRERGK